jgi:hypothetical protein
MDERQTINKPCFVPLTAAFGQSKNGNKIDFSFSRQ